MTDTPVRSGTDTLNDLLERPYICTCPPDLDGHCGHPQCHQIDYDRMWLAAGEIRARITQK